MAPAVVWGGVGWGAGAQSARHPGESLALLGSGPVVAVPMAALLAVSTHWCLPRARYADTFPLVPSLTPRGSCGLRGDWDTE